MLTMASTSRRTLAPLVLVAASMLFASPDVEAAPVTFSTAGVFTCDGCTGSGSNSVIFIGGMGNAVMVTFTGLGSTSLDTPTGTSFGAFQTFFSGNGAVATSGTFALTITQTLPTAGADSFASTLTGQFSASSSGSGLVHFTTTSVTIGDVTYRITNDRVNLVPPATSNGVTRVQGEILTSSTPVPEPASMWLIGSGLAAFTVVWRRRRVRS